MYWCFIKKRKQLIMIEEKGWGGGGGNSGNKENMSYKLQEPEFDPLHVLEYCQVCIWWEHYMVE